MFVNQLIKESGVILSSDESWSEARRRANIIGPLAESQTISRNMSILLYKE